MDMFKICTPKYPSTSSAGVWLKETPFNAYLPLVMIQIIIIISISRILHFFLRRLGQSIIVSQILTGILLSRTAFGRLQTIQILFSETNVINLRIIGIIGLILFNFTMGVKIDLGFLKQSGKKTLIIGFTCHMIPTIFVVTSYTVSHLLLDFDSNGQIRFDIYRDTVLPWSLSSIVVVACLLDEMNLLNSKIGRMAIAASLIETILLIIYDVIGGIYFLGSLSWGPYRAFLPMISFVCFATLIAVVARPVTQWMVKRTIEGAPLAEEYIGFILLMTLAFAFSSTVIGQGTTAGVFFLGLALPSGPPLGSTLVTKLEGIVEVLFLPIFIATLGFPIDFSMLGEFLGMTIHFVLFDVVTLIGKIVGVIATASVCRVRFQNILILTLILNAKGISELECVFRWEDLQNKHISFITVRLFEILVIAVVVPPLLKILYKPSRRYYESRRRSLLGANKKVELKILSCVYNQDQVPPSVNIIESLCMKDDNPLSISVLHLIQLVGRVSPVLVPYKKGMCSYGSAETDHIVATFTGFEETKMDSMGSSIQTYLSISNYSSMFDDICTLSMEKKMSMIFLPFHRTQMDETLTSANEHIREVNSAVLEYATCSVSIIIDRGGIAKNIQIIHSRNNVFDKICVYFVGGPDDREALALAMRMALNPSVCVTIIHFKPRSTGDPIQFAEKMLSERRLDEETIKDFLTENKDMNKTAYMEMEVSDGEEMVGIIRKTVDKFNLVIVGRREGIEKSEMMTGMSEWNEFPELGVFGDMLASKDFDCRISTLVVQQ